MVQRPVDIPTDAKGTTKQFNASQITEGEKLFEDNCKSCHAGGNTLQDPTISLSLLTLKQATPPRDNLAALVSFIQAPRSYDGKAASATCRGGAFLKPEEQEKLAAFILRAADRAQGWATMPKL
jgi:photosystem II cytochrome c550